MIAHTEKIDRRYGPWPESRRQAHSQAMRKAYATKPWLHTRVGTPWSDEMKKRHAAVMRAFWTPEKRLQASKSHAGIKLGPKIKR